MTHHANKVFRHRRAAVPAGGKTVDIAFVECAALTERGFLNAFSMRGGGVSAMPAEALHLSPKNDAHENYQENLRRFLAAIEASEMPLATANQTHSDIRIHVDSLTPALPTDVSGEGDALLSNESGILLGVKTADCLPVLIADPATGAFAAVHAGWRGTLARIVQKTLHDLKIKHGVQPATCVAALGPAACGGCYEIDGDVIAAFESEFPNARAFLKRTKDGAKALLDVSAANRQQLEESGVKPENIFEAPSCTMHENELFFSHRKEARSGQTVGRQLSVIGRR